MEVPVADEKVWWEQPAAEEAEPVEAVAAAGPTVAEPVPEADGDDPWAEFIGGESEAGGPPPATGSLAESWTPTTPQAPAWPPPAPSAPHDDEDVWGDLAAQTEEAVFGADGGLGIDIASSLESQMAEAAQSPREWEARESRWERAPYDDEQSAFEPGEAGGEEDVILRAFERHAATPDPETAPDPAVERETEEALEALFGNDAAEIVEHMDDGPEPRSFIRLSGFAPQRSGEAFDGNWAPQGEVQEVLPHDRTPFGGSDGAGFLPPPWAVEELEGEDGGTRAPTGSKTKTWIRELVETGLLALLVPLGAGELPELQGRRELDVPDTGRWPVPNREQTGVLGSRRGEIEQVRPVRERGR